MLKGVLRWVFLANHLASTDNLTSNNQETKHTQTQNNVNTKVALMNNNIHKKTILTERTDRAWFNRLFQPGNGAGLFLQPPSPHGALY